MSVVKMGAVRNRCGECGGELRIDYVVKEAGRTEEKKRSHGKKAVRRQSWKEEKK